MSTTLIGIKLGSYDTWIYKQDSGIVLNEPTMIAISTNLKNKEIKAVGYEAKKMLGRTPDNISLFSPISNGLVQYEELTSLLIREFLKKVFPVRKFNQKIKALVYVPECSTLSEKKQFENCCFKAGITDVVIIPEVICYDLGNSNKLSNESAKMYVNIGHDQTTASIVSHNSIVNAYSISIGGTIIDIAIKKYIEDKYFIKIGTEQAEFIKNEICALFENYTASLNITGISSKTQSKEQVTVNSSEFYPIISYYYSKIAEMLKSVIASCDPVTITDISQNGIFFYGDGCEIAGFELFMLNKTGFLINLNTYEDFEENGTTQLIKSPHLIKNITN